MIDDGVLSPEGSTGHRFQYFDFERFSSFCARRCDEEGSDSCLASSVIIKLKSALTQEQIEN